MKRGGFTLVELLVALFITAILFAIGYGAINQALKNRDRVQQSQDRLVALQRTIRTMVQDFAQTAPRPVRDGLGSGYVAALASGGSGGVLVTLTRAGWSNPAGVQRPSLQRVRYSLVDGHLRRDILSCARCGHRRAAQDARSDRSGQVRGVPIQGREQLALGMAPGQWR